MSRIGRGQKRSVAGASAYRSGELLVDPRTSAEYDYRRRRGVASTHLLVPGAPADALDRQHVWGEVERHHKKGNAVTGREIVVSIPWDLDPAERQELVLRYASEVSERYGVVADVAIHLPSMRPGRDPRNHHAHILLSACSARFADGELVLGKKVMELDPIAMRQMGREPVCESERARWAALCVEARRAAGLPEQPIDHRSYERQGVEQIPQVHLGPAAKDNLEKHLAGENVVLLDRTKQWLKREEARAALREAQRLEAEIAEEEAAELAGQIDAEPVAELAPMPAPVMEPAPAPRRRREWPALSIEQRRPEPEPEPARVIEIYPPAPQPVLRTRAELEALLAEAERLAAQVEQRRAAQERARRAWEAAEREARAARQAQAEIRSRWWARAAAVVGLGPLPEAQRRLAEASRALGPARQDAEQTQILLGLAQRRLDAIDLGALQRDLDQVREDDARRAAIVDQVIDLVRRADAVVPADQRSGWPALVLLDRLTGSIEALRTRLLRPDGLDAALAHDLGRRRHELEALEGRLEQLEQHLELPPPDDDQDGDDQGWPAPGM